MRTAIGLDDEAIFEADKVEDEGSEWTLTAELESAQATAAQNRPQPTLGVGQGRS